MVLAVFIIMLILIVPLFFSLYFYYDISGKKVYYAVYLFKVIRLNSGYLLKRERGGFYLHLSNKKAVILKPKLKSVFNKRGNYLKYFSVVDIYVCSDAVLSSVYSLTFLYSLISNLKSIVKIFSNCNYSYDFNLLCDESLNRGVKLSVNTYVNLISILILLIANAISRVNFNEKRDKFKFNRQYD